MAWLLYGQKADGELLHISEAARGDACGCFCPHCETPLAAKKGKVKVHHFAHLGQTCAYVSVYDFLHIEHYIDTTLSLTQWANWKQKDIAQTGIRLKAENEQYAQEMSNLMKVINKTRAKLVNVSEPHPGRKQRSKVRQANFEVFQQWDAYLSDHNAPAPDIERVRDVESTRYTELYYMSEGRWGGRYTTGLSAWPNELWYEENKVKQWIPWWLVDGGLAILNDYQPVRRKLTTSELHLDAFDAEKARFERFRLYLLLVKLTNRPPLFKIGITSREDLTERMSEIRADLQGYGIAEVSVLVELPGHAYLESYFKKKYAPAQTKLGKLTEYFTFSDEQLDTILDELQSLALPAIPANGRGDRIKEGMAQARKDGIHVGRPQGTEADERFLKKPKSILVADLIARHPDWSLRDVSRHSGIAINTVCKVAKLVGASTDVPELTLADMPATDEVLIRTPVTTPFMEYTDETVERRKRVIDELQQADDYMVITVSKSDDQGRKPIGMHISRLNAIGPALSTLMHQDRDFCEAMGEMVQEARRRRYGW